MSTVTSLLIGAGIAAIYGYVSYAYYGRDFWRTAVLFWAGWNFGALIMAVGKKLVN